MDITVDTSVLLAVCTNEPSKARLIELSTGCNLLAPGSVHWEVGNALSAMVKRERISVSQAQSCIAVYQKIPIKFINIDLQQSLALSARFRMYAYDAYLLMCAAQQNTPLLTLDGPLKIAAVSMGIKVLEV